jgi:hypothetical protein
METRVIRLKQIKPIDGPRKKSLHFFRESWGQEGPPEVVIDLTCFSHQMIYYLGAYLSDDMNHRLGYLYERYGGDQKVKINFVRKGEPKPDYNGIIEEREKMIDKGIQTWDEWLRRGDE